jgi:hypothetical protein
MTPLEQFKYQLENHRNRDKMDNPSTDIHDGSLSKNGEIHVLPLYSGIPLCWPSF